MKIIDELIQNDSYTEEDLYKAIQARVELLLNKSPDLLMSYLYRLDIDEGKIKAVLKKGSTVDPVKGLSQLILDRQKIRITYKATNKQSKIPGWEW